MYDLSSSDMSDFERQVSISNHGFRILILLSN